MSFKEMEENIDPLVFEVLDKHLCMYEVMSDKDFKVANLRLKIKAMKSLVSSIETYTKMLCDRPNPEDLQFKMYLEYDMELLKKFIDDWYKRS